jgi:hypothetical protein
MIINTSKFGIEPVTDLATIDVPNLQEYRRAIFGRSPKLDMLAKVLVDNPGKWFTFSEPVYGRSANKFCESIYSRLEMLTDKHGIILEWCHQLPEWNHYHLPPNYYLYAFRIFETLADGSLAPIPPVNPTTL